nr:hypothetical protein [Tanacetum cinerariifolium]
MTMISKDGIIYKFPRYHSSKDEEPTGQSKALNKYGFFDHPELQRNEFAPHRLPQREGNMNGWLIEDEPLEHEASAKEVDSDLESTASSKPMMKKTTKVDLDRGSTTMKGGNYNYGGQHNYICATTYVDLQQLQTILPHIVTQVTNNVNNANGENGRNSGNGGSNGCTYKGFMACNPKEYDGKGGVIALTRWIKKIENWNTQVQARRHEAAIGISWADFKALLVEEFYPSNEMEKLESEFWNHKMVGANHASYTDQFHELAKLVPHSVTPESSCIKRYIAGLAPEIQGMLRATQPTTIQCAILRARILTDEAVSCGKLTKSNEKRKGVEMSSKQGGGRNDNKRAKVSKGFVASTAYRNEYGGSLPKCAKCLAHHRKDRPCLVCFNCQKLGHISRNYCSPIKQVVSINAVRGGYEQGICYKCGRNQNSRNNGNQVKGRDFNVNAVGALQDPNVMTGTFSLNHHYATLLFDSGADFSFISTSFAHLLNVKSSFVNPGYLMEVADGKKVEVDSVIRNRKLELRNSLFSIDLIPVGHGSFDMIVGMDWLSEHKAEIVCHEKVDEPKLSDISIVRDFVEVFPEDLSRFPPQRQVEFRIDLVSKATPVAMSPYRLAHSEMQELSAQLQELQDKGFIPPSHSRELNKLTIKNRYPLSRINDLFDQLQGARYFSNDRPSIWLSSAPIYSKSKDEHEVHLRLVLELMKKEELYAKFSKCEFGYKRCNFSKNKKYEWGIEHVEAFHTLKHNLCNALILSLPDGVEDFVVYCVASNQGLGCVLMQRGKRHYLHGMKSVIYTDHQSLQHILNQKELNMRQRRWIKLFNDYECEIRYHPSKANVVADVLSKKKRVKPRRVRAMAMTIQFGIRGMIIAAQGEAFKQENILAKRLHGLDQQMERREDGSLYFLDRIWVPLVGGVQTIIIDETHKTRYSIHPRADKMYHDIRNMYWWPGITRNIAIYVRKCLTCSKVKAKHQRPSGLFQQPEIPECKWDKITMEFITKLPRRKSLEFEEGDQVMLKVSPWKGVIRLGKKGKLAPRYVGPFEILERIGPVAYQLRLPEEFSEVHDTFHVSNLKKCLVDASLHAPLDEIKVDKTLRFVEEPLEIIDREVKRLKRSRISLVKVRWNSKRGPEFTWEREDFMKSKYPQLFVDRADESAS